MPRQKDHLEKARHNESFVASFDISSTPFLDWAITGMFYSALHYLEAYFAKQGYHSPDHRTRDSTIQRDGNIRHLFVAYSELKNFSINARYSLKQFKASDVTATLQPHLELVKRTAISLL
jgi:hypothetical protein